MVTAVTRVEDDMSKERALEAQEEAQLHELPEEDEKFARGLIEKGYTFKAAMLAVEHSKDPHAPP